MKRWFGALFCVCMFVWVCLPCYICFGMRIHVEHSITGVRPLLTVDAKACREISQNILKNFPSTPYPHRHPVLFRFRFVAENFLPLAAFLCTSVCMLRWLFDYLFSLYVHCVWRLFIHVWVSFFSLSLAFSFSLFALNINMMLFPTGYGTVAAFARLLYYCHWCSVRFLLKFPYVCRFYSLYWTSGYPILFHLSAPFAI